jgi:hypothetical protein
MAWTERSVVKQKTGDWNYLRSCGFVFENLELGL